jgi:exopolysaccharide production protein ExoQ
MSHTSTAQYDIALASGRQSRFPKTFLQPSSRPVWQDTITWLLLWPMLTLIARQVVYFSGPARDTAAFALGGAHESHVYTYVDFFFLLGFTLACARQTWNVAIKNKALLGLMCLAVISVLWSTAKQTTFQVSIKVWVGSLFACYLATRFTSQWLMRFLIFMGVVTALGSILFAVAIPSYGVFAGYAGGAWQGITSHKNTLGLAMAYLLTPIFFVDGIRLNRRVLYSLLMLFVLYKSQSKGAYLDTAAMLLFVGFLYLARRLRISDLMLIILVSGVLITATVIIGVVFLEPITFALGKDPTLDGRTVIYKLVWQAITKHPWLGYGYTSFWYPGSNESQFISLSLDWPGIGYSENGFLELLLALGFVGLSMLLAMLGKAIVQGSLLMRSATYTPRIGWFMTILFLALMTNIDAGWFLAVDNIDWVLIIVACVGLNEEWGKFRTAKATSVFA